MKQMLFLSLSSFSKGRSNSGASDTTKQILSQTLVNGCVRVCVRERERGIEREKERVRESSIHYKRTHVGNPICGPSWGERGRRGNNLCARTDFEKDVTHVNIVGKNRDETCARTPLFASQKT